METQEAVRYFLTAKEARGLSPRTIESYRYRLRIFAGYYTELPTTPEPIESFLLQIGPTQETRDTYFRLLRNFYRWLVRRKHLSADDNPIPAIEAPRISRRVPRSLSPDELRQLLLFPGHNENIAAFLAFLANTGVRLSEALTVTPSSFRGNVVTVSGKTGEREVPISPDVRDQVLAVLPWPWANRDTAGRAVHRAFLAAGFSGKRASAHTLRHTFCRLWDGDETLLVGIMGWTSSAMMRRYRPYNVNRAVEQHESHNPLRFAELSTGPVQPSLL